MISRVMLAAVLLDEAELKVQAYAIRRQPRWEREQVNNFC